MKRLVGSMIALLTVLMVTLIYNPKAEKLHEKLIDVKAYSYLHDAPLKELISNNTHGTNEITIRFSFRVDEFKNYENIFQTASVNDGFRMEINDAGNLALVFSTNSGLDSIQVDPNVKKGVWNDVVIHYDREKVLQVYYNKQSIFNGIRPDIKVKINEIVIGHGFSEERPFLGDLKNFNIQYNVFNIRPHSDFYIGLLQFVLVMSVILLLTNEFMRSSQGNAYIHKIFADRTAFLTFLGIGVLVLVGMNALYCNLLGALGYTEFAYTNFLFPSDDRFADLIKIAISFTKPLANVIDLSKISEWPEIFKNYFYNNPYGGIEALQDNKLSNLANIPFGRLYHMINGYIAFVLSPTLLYSFYLTLYACSIGCMIYLLKNKNTFDVQWVFVILMILSYPGLIILFRGHFMSAFAVMILAIALVALIKDKQRLSWIAFGIAMNIRPNFVFFAPLIYATFRSPKPFFLYCLKLAIWSITFFLTLYWSVHTLYPDYTFARSVEATRIYNALYNYGNLGLAFGSSFYGALYAAAKLYGIDPHRVSVIGHLIAGASIVSVGIGILLRIFSATEIVFLLAAIYSLFTPVLGDYQLILFILPILVFLVARDEYRDDSPKHIFIIALASLLLLSPKNYVYMENLGAYSQVFVNPTILLAAVSYLLWKRSTLVNGRIKHAAQ